jgi:O-antigen/teichoic acid export membrane protein
MRPGDGGLAAGIVASTLLAYAYQLVGGRLLGPEDFAPVSVLWTLMFLTGTVGLTPLEQLVARESTAGRRVLTRRSGAVVGVVAVTALAAVTFTTLSREALFLGSWGFVVLALLVVLVTAPLFASRGLAIGHRRFGHYGLMLGLEGAGRLVFGALGTLVVGGAVGWAWGIALGPLLGLLVPGLHLELRANGGRRGGEGAFLAPYLGASAASQLMLAGAPLAVAALGASPTSISVVFVTFTLFRAPVTMVYLAQGRLLNLLVRLELAGDEPRLRQVQRGIELAGLGLVATAGGVAWVVGPAVVALLYGADFRPDPLVVALAATGVAGAAVAQLLGQLLVARGRTARLAGRWTAGLVVALIVLILDPAGAEVTVALAFALGELTAAVAMALGVRGDVLRAEKASGRRAVDDAADRAADLLTDPGPGTATAPATDDGAADDPGPVPAHQ